MTEIAAPGAVPIPANEQVATAMDTSATVAARMEAFPLSRWHLKARIIIVGGATFFDAVDTAAIGLVLPVIGQAWHMTPEQIGWLISGGFLGQLIGAIGFGHLAERIGRISTIMITTAIFALGGLASAFATGFASMIVLRMLQGLGLGAEVPSRRPTSMRLLLPTSAARSCCYTSSCLRLASWLRVLSAAGRSRPGVGSRCF